ncbi:MAG TPA: YdeI/OmpD-associated family protein [Solirubrobacteraceae bacterium]|nr:YdeI/OmpD-associated family protein [Solirubrobacteraceae bacterium]
MRITTTLQPRGPAAAVVLTDEQVQTLGAATKTPPVSVTVNGHTFAGRVGRMGGENLIGFSKAVREACGVKAGDKVEVEIVLDEGPREVELPPALASALDAEPELRARYESLAYTHRKELARSVSEAKREETRERRLAEALSRLREG